MPKYSKPPATPRASSQSDLVAFFQHGSVIPGSEARSKMAPTRTSTINTRGTPSPLNALGSEVNEAGGLVGQPSLATRMLHDPEQASLRDAGPAEAVDMPASSRELRDMFASLRADLDSLAGRIENSWKRELQEVQQRVDGVASDVLTLQTAQSTLNSRLSAVETQQNSYMQALSALRLKVDDGENRSRRNNVRIRGLPEATAGPDLRSTVSSLLNLLLERDPAVEMELDRVHRVAGPVNPDRSVPRDVLCRIHFYQLKEEVMRKAWEKKSIDFDGAVITFLPDLSSHTLFMRRQIKPLLRCLVDVGATYRWGHPFHLQIQLNGRRFSLHRPDQLPALFTFLDCPSVEIPNWLLPLGDLPTRNVEEPRPRRSRSRRPRRAVPNRSVDPSMAEM